MLLEDAVLDSQIFVPSQQLLVHSSRHVGQDTRPIHNRPLPYTDSATASWTVREIVLSRLRNYYRRRLNHCFLGRFSFLAIRGPGTLALLTPGSRVALASAAGSTTNVALLGGLPAQGPILFAGPFVMDTSERLLQAKQDYLAGRMGRLEGVPF